MVESIHQSRCIGDGFKPPKGAVINSYGIERLGKVTTRLLLGVNKGVERK